MEQMLEGELRLRVHHDRRFKRHYQCDQIGRFLHLVLLFKAFGNINLPRSPTFSGNFYKGVKIYHLSSETFLCNF